MKSRYPVLIIVVLFLVGISNDVYTRDIEQASSTCGCKESLLQWYDQADQDPNLLYERSAKRQEYINCLAECFYYGGNTDIQDLFGNGRTVVRHGGPLRETIAPWELFSAISWVHCAGLAEAEAKCKEECQKIKPFAPCPTIRFQETQPECPEWDRYNNCMGNCDKGASQCRDNYNNYIRQLFENQSNSSVRISSPGNGAVIPFVPDQTTITINVEVFADIQGEQIKSAYLNCQGPEGVRTYPVAFSSSQSSKQISVALEGLGIQDLTLEVETSKGQKLSNKISVTTQLMEVGSNLTILEKDIEFTFYDQDIKRPFEPQADKQVVKVTVQNRDTAEAQNVYVQFSAGPADQDGQLLDSIRMGSIPRQSSKSLFYTWDLKGGQKENWRLYAHAYIPNVADMSPMDNFASRDINIFFAHNGQRAFNLASDSYKFPNRGIDTSEFVEIYKEFLGYILTEGFTISLQETGQIEQLKKDLSIILPPIFLERYKSYLSTLSGLGINGLCHGFAASSLDFFNKPGLNPFSKPVYHVSYDELGSIPFAYHLDQMSQFIDIGLSPQQTIWKSSGGNLINAYNNLKNALKNGQGRLVGFFGPDWGHTILAYKMIEVKGEDAEVITYDSNYPLDSLRQGNYYASFSIRRGNSQWLIENDFNGYYPIFGNDAYSTQELWTYPVRLNLKSEEIKFYLDLFKNSLSAYNELLTLIDKYVVQLSCPADLLLTNRQGRRTGIINGRFISEIPGVERELIGETEIFFVPKDLSLNIEIRGTGQGIGTLSTIQSDNGSLKVNKVENIPLKNRSSAVTTTTAGGNLNSVSSANSALAVSTFVMSSDDPIWNQVKISNRKPEASFSMMPEYPEAGDDMVLVSTATDPDGDALSYEWFLGDRIIGRNENVEINAPSWGEHEIKLVVKDSKGESSSAQRQIRISSSGSSGLELDEMFDEDTLILIAQILVTALVLFGVWFFFKKRKKKEAVVVNKVSESMSRDSSKELSKFCSQCGKPVLKGSKFCGSCGNKL